MDGISRSRGWDKEIPHCVLPMEQLVLSDKWARNPDDAKKKEMDEITKKMLAQTKSASWIILIIWALSKEKLFSQFVTT